MGDWILVSEQLPKEGQRVFVYLFGSDAYIAWMTDGEWETDDFTVDEDCAPIAWMPLPKPYKADY